VTSTIQPSADIAAVLTLSDERDIWMRRVDQAYRDGFNDGRAHACVNIAVMEEHREKRQWWNDWWGKVQRITRNWTSPDMAINRVMAEIAADQKLVTDALAKRAEDPSDLTPLEWCILNRIRGERLDPYLVETDRPGVMRGAA
jgi:hypothetical protein